MPGTDGPGPNQVDGSVNLMGRFHSQDSGAQIARVKILEYPMESFSLSFPGFTVFPELP